MKLLRDLNRILDEVSDHLSLDIVDDDADNDSLASWLDEIPTQTELQQYHGELINVIDCLFEMAMLIRRPANLDLSREIRRGSKSAYESYDKDHVRNKFPQTSSDIVHRLGCAITQRRNYLDYRARHHAKLGKGIDEAQGIQGSETNEAALSETIATDFYGDSGNLDDLGSDLVNSQTSYATSLLDGRDKVFVPPLPKESAGGKPFECPYCFFVIEVKTRQSWIRHIFKDIRPYVCVFPDCTLPEKLYDSRHEWFFHETTEHHLRSENFDCLLCKESLISEKSLERHLARHLEDLALFAVQKSNLDDNDDYVFDERNTASELDFDSSDNSDNEFSGVQPDVIQDLPYPGLETFTYDEPQNEDHRAIETSGLISRPRRSPSPQHSEIQQTIPSPRSRTEAEKRLIKEKDQRQYTERVAKEEEKAHKRALRIAELERLERKEAEQYHTEYEERKRLESVQKARKRQDQEDFNRLQAKRRQELGDIEAFSAAERAEQRQRENTRLREEHLLEEEQRLARAHRANTPRQPRHRATVHDGRESLEDRGERFIREAIKEENLKRFERDSPYGDSRPHRSYDDNELRRKSPKRERYRKAPGKISQAPIPVQGLQETHHIFEGLELTNEDASDPKKEEVEEEVRPHEYS